ncbi:MAG: Gfo/Idh/MocA family oxidoreductase [Chloroflexi bacterium]|nr:Gfo/Idh/MocA family oxidoreductase [Chloroflexota bacterium]
MAKIGIGVIGIGRMGQVYASHVASQIEDATLVAVADAYPPTLEAFTAKSNSVKGYSDYHDLLADKEIQGVIVATSTSTHRDVVLAAAAAGKAIFCEKPTALTLAATDEMLTAVHKAGVMFQVGFMRRFDKAYVEARRQIDADVIGQPIVIRSIGRDPFRTSLEFANPAVSGGLIVDMAIHDFDIIRWMMGAEVERVYTETASNVYPELLEVGDVDNAMISVRFANNGLGNVEVSRTAGYGYDIRCTVVGTKGTLEIGYLQETPVLTLTKDIGVRHDVVPYFKERFGPAYTKQIEHFAECLRDGKPPQVTPTDARAALQVAMAATVSQHEQRVVYINEIQ